MARKRFISPEFFQHGDLFDAEQANQLPLRLAFAGLWTQSDRRGIFPWKPRELKLAILPYDVVDFEAALNALVTAGFVRTYEVDGKKYGQLPSFSRWQSFHRDEKQGDAPAPPHHGAGTVLTPGSTDATESDTTRQHGAGTVLTTRITEEPESETQHEHRASTPVAVAVAVAGTTTTLIASTTGVPAPGRSRGRPGDGSNAQPVSRSGAFQEQYGRLCSAALPHQRAALDCLLSNSDIPELLLASIHAIATGMNPIVSSKGETAGIDHVLIALPEAVLKFFADGKRSFDGPLFTGCVRRVINRRPEPTTADQRAGASQLREVAQLRFDEPRTTAEMAVADRTRAAAMRDFYASANRPEKAKRYQDELDALDQDADACPVDSQYGEERLARDHAAAAYLKQASRTSTGSCVPVNETPGRSRHRSSSEPIAPTRVGEVFTGLTPVGVGHVS